MTYKWREGYKHPGVSADVAGDVCKQLESAGNLNAVSLVEASKPADAPLHSAFEWDDAIASRKWREQQARCIINSIELVRVSENDHEPVRAFFNIKSCGSNYTSTQTIINTPTMMEELMELAMRELKSFRKKYGRLEELKPIMAEIDKFQEEGA